MSRTDIKKRVRQLVKSQRFAVIATEMNGKPYTNLVAFASTNDLKIIVFATKRDTQKHLNIRKNNHIAVLLDNRQNAPSDFSDAVVVTAQGYAYDAQDKKEKYQKLLLKKHPDLAVFLTSPSCVFIAVQVTTYQVVQKFEKITILRIQDEPA